MPDERVVIAIDAMGGDNAPDVVLEGVELALQASPGMTVRLYGPEHVVMPFAKDHRGCEPVVCTQVIEMAEHPAKAVRAKKDSTIVRACKSLKEGEVDGFFSAGSTGAVLAAATLVAGRIKGIKRPALAQIVPSAEKHCVLLDVGANADCKPEYLVQFANMGSVYAKGVLGREYPVVGLLNIGEEDSKGSTFAQDANSMLSRDVPGFAGNCEPSDLCQGRFDVVVTDGFTGNIALKTIEGTAKLIFHYLKQALYATTLSKVGALLAKSQLKELKGTLSPDTYGASPLLGVKGAVFVGHGSSNAIAVKNGILGCEKAIEAKVPQMIGNAAVGKPTSGEE